MKKENMSRILNWGIILLIVLAGQLYSATLTPEYSIEPQENLVKGVILSIENVEDVGQESMVKSSQLAQVKILEGKYKGFTFESYHYQSGNPAYDFDVFAGDKVLLSLDIQDEQLEAVHIAQYERESMLYVLVILFFLTIIIVGAWRGVKSIISLGLTALAIIKILVPAILSGKDPVTSVIIVCSGVTIITLLLISGLNRKSFSAILGTIMGTLIASLIAGISITIGRLTGLASEEGVQLLYLPQSNGMDFQGILLAGIIIGALGAIMDVAMSVSSTIHEVKSVDPTLNWWQLTKSGLNVGRDIIGTMSNTLILAYTGGSLPLILLISGHQIPMIKIINLDIFAIEIIRALAGSIGLFLAVPFTALIGGLLYGLVGSSVKTSKNTTV